MQNKAFTLIELSIVLVIIGLLVGGIMGGQTLVQQAKLQSVISDVQQYKRAWNTFKMQYNGIPGDITGSSFWTGAGDGDNNGSIDSSTALTAPLEDLYAWQHLSLAGLVNGSYSGAVGSVRYVFNTNAPSSKINGTGYEIRGKSQNNYNGYTTNFLELGTISASQILDGAALSPKDAYYIDSKIDNGIPSSGTVFVGRGNSVFSGCVSALWGAASVTYVLTDTEKTCIIRFDLEN